MLKKLAMLITVFMFMMVVVSPSNAASVKWKLAHNRPVTDDIHANMLEFAKNVKEKTQGEVIVEIYPAGQLGSAEAVFERMGLGTVDMQCAWMNTTLDKRLEIYNFPGYTGSYKEVEKVYHVGSPFMNLLQELCDPLGVKLLGSYAQYLAGAAFVQLPKDVKNPNAKHKQKLRVPSQKMFSWMWEGFGYMTTPLPSSEVFTALQTKVIDGIATQGAQTIYMNSRDIVKYWVAADTNYEPWFICVSQESYDKLSKKNQKVISEEARKIEAKKFLDAEPIMRSYEKKLQKHGVKVIELTSVEKKAFQEKIKKYVLPKMEKELGKDFYQRTIKALEDSLK
ncbi:MAG: TRAP transporter substrate-binding protein DctP [Cloacibacillus sp.]